MFRSRVLTAVFCVMAVKSSAYAQDFQPLQDVFLEAASPYAPTRCGALYQVMMEWIGIDRMGNETWQSTDQIRRNMIITATMIGQEESGGTLEEQVASVLRNVRNIADIYLSRFEKNYAMSGNAFSGDALIEADLDFCELVSEGGI